MVGLNCRCGVGAVAPANAHRRRLQRGQVPRLDRLPNLVLHTRRTRHGTQAGRPRREGCRVMVLNPTSLRRAFLPGGVFVAVLIVHYGWVGLYPEKCAAADQPATFRECRSEECSCAPATASPSWLQHYLGTQSYWLGLSYGMSLTFAAAAFRRYGEERRCAARNVALGSVTLSGFLAVASCYLLGCCGSPMLPIYMNLLGTAFLPFAKPLVAGLTALSLVGAWWWMKPSAGSRCPATGRLLC